MCKLADMSVLSFAKIIGAVHRSATLAAYRTHPGLQNKFRSQYRVHLTCGLHLGWVIEGAVGSEYKIEASYLSPNVEVAINVEEATQLYRVSCGRGCVRPSFPDAHRGRRHRSGACAFLA